MSHRHRSRRRGWRRLLVERRLPILLGILGVLIAANLYVVVTRSPQRRKRQILNAGIEAYERREFDVARIHFRRYLDIAPKDPKGWYMLALALSRTGDEAGAIEKLEEAARIRPEFDLAQIALAERFLRSGRYRAALERADLALADGPAPVAAWVVKGEALLSLGDLGGALEAFQEAVLEKPDMGDVLLKLADLHRTRARLTGVAGHETRARQRYEDAELAGTRLLERVKGSTTALLWIAKARAGLGRLDEAVDAATSLTRLEPDVVSHHLLLSDLLYLSGKVREAENALDHAWQRKPDPLLALRRAELLAELGEAGKAEALLSDAITGKFPDDVRLFIALVRNYHQRGMSKKAREVLGSALERFGPHTQLYEARGDLAVAGGDTAAGLDSYREAVRVDGSNVSARRKILALLVPRLAATLERKEEDEDLEAEVNSHLEFFLDPETGVGPYDRKARGWKARLALARGDSAAAAKLLDAGEGGEPDTWEGLRVLGVAQLADGRYARAAETLYRALGHPDCPRTEVDFELAHTAAFRTGHFAREVEIAREAVEKWPDDPDWRLKLATSLFRDNRLTEALAECDRAKALLVGAPDPRAHLLAARVHQARGELDKARAELENAVVIRRDAETRGALYAFFAATGNTALAEEGFRGLVAENPEDPDAYLRFGDFLLKRSGGVDLTEEQRTGLEREAFRQYQKARELDPGSREVLYRLAELRISQANSEAEAVEAAMLAVREIVEEHPDDPYVLYFEGKLHLVKKEAGQAAEKLAEYVRKNPNDSAGLYYLAIAYRRTGQSERAREAFLAALGLNPNMVEAKLQLAALYFNQGLRARASGDFKTARSAFEEVVGIDPREPGSRRFLAEALAALGLNDRAAQQVEQALRLKPDDLGALFLSGLLAGQRAEFGIAENRFRRLTELQPENFLGYLYLGLVYVERGEHEQARAVLRKAYGFSPDSDEVINALVLNEVRAGKIDDALAVVESEMERDENRPFLHLLAGDLYQKLDRKREAVEVYRRAFRISPEFSIALCKAAALLADTGSLDEAVEILSGGAQLAPKPAMILTLEGKMRLARGETGEAERVLRDAVAADPAFGHAQRELGLLLARAGREAEARRMLQEAVQAGVADASVHFVLGNLALAGRKQEEAEREYRRVLEIEPEYLPALNNLALLLSEHGDRDEEAVEIAARAVKVNPRDALVADTYGWILYRAGQHEEAAKALLPAAEGMPDSADVHYHAGMACKATYRWPEARKLLTRALQLDGNADWATEAKKALAEMKQ